MVPDALVDLAVRAARRGSAAAARWMGAPVRVTYKSSRTDPVTDADHASDAAIASLIHAERPDDGILSEEGLDRPSASGLRWVVDPLDGTVNYLYRLPHFAVSVACERYLDGDWAGLVGVVYDCACRETFIACVGAGARLVGPPVADARPADVPLAVSDPVPLPAALVATEFSYRRQARAAQAATAGAVLAQARDMRTTGSSALDLCWTAAGRFDAFYENELPRWDWAAGALIVTEAGGRVAPLGSGVLAAGPALFDQLRPLVTAPGPAVPSGPVAARFSAGQGKAEQ